MEPKILLLVFVLKDILFSAPPHVNASPIPFSVNNGVNVDMQNFLGLLEHEESDFVDQVKKEEGDVVNADCASGKVNDLVVAVNQENGLAKREES